MVVAGPQTHIYTPISQQPLNQLAGSSPLSTLQFNPRRWVGVLGKVKRARACVCVCVGDIDRIDR